jgi:hypothetical protein
LTESVEETKRRRRRPLLSLARKVDRLLSPELREEVEKQLLGGVSPGKVSMWLRVQKGVDIGEHALLDYQRSLQELSNALKGNRYYEHYTLGTKQKIDALEELYRAAQTQMKRLGIGLKAEEDAKRLSSVMDKSLDTLRNILKDIAELEMEMGIRKRVISGEAPGKKLDLKEILETVMASQKKGDIEPAGPSEPGNS